MPSGKSHDAISYFLAPPVYFGVWRFTANHTLASAVAVAFLFGSLMFGPDLDTKSVQYRRWGVFRFLWLPYQIVFAHRSRWTHGLIFGTFVRVVYFAGAISLITAGGAYFMISVRAGKILTLEHLQARWERFGALSQIYLGDNGLLAIFFGLWLGAAAHIFTDIFGTFIKTGKIKGHF